MKRGVLPKPVAPKPRKSVITLVVTHTLATKRELRHLFLGEVRTRAPSSISKITVRNVDFD